MATRPTNVRTISPGAAPQRRNFVETTNPPSPRPQNSPGLSQPPQEDFFDIAADLNYSASRSPRPSRQRPRTPRTSQTPPQSPESLNRDNFESRNEFYARLEELQRQRLERNRTAAANLRSTAPRAQDLGGDRGPSVISPGYLQVLERHRTQQYPAGPEGMAMRDENDRIRRMFLRDELAAAFPHLDYLQEPEPF